MLELDYVLDPETGEPHMYKHGVYEDDVEHVFSHRPVRGRGRNGALTATGPKKGGRVIRVIYKNEEDRGSVFVITAYHLTGNDLRAYHRSRGRQSR